MLLLRLLASPRLQVFGVGDDDQVIYAYSGADPHFLIEYDTWFPGATKYTLETNYRCPQPVVQAATNLLSWNRIRVPKTIKPGPEAIQDVSALDVRKRPGGELAIEAADQISAWLESGIEPHHIAVLTRVNASLIPMKAALVDRDIPTQDELSGNSLNRSMVRALFAWMRLGREPDKARRADVLEAIRRPSRGLNGVAASTSLPTTMTLDRRRAASDTVQDRHATKWLKFCDDIAAIARATKTGDSRSAVQAVLNAAGLISSAQSLDRSSRQLNKPAHEDDLAALERAAAIHPDLATFESWLRSTMDRPQTEGGVMLSSVHRVKGMEWPRVIVLGADNGVLPHRLCDDHEEERRIFHVAITRCQEQVVILADADADQPSPFIAELASEAPPIEERRPSPDPFARAKRATRSKRSASSPASDAAIGDTVAISGGIEGQVIHRSNSDVAVKTASGAQMVFPITEISRIVKKGASNATDGSAVEEPLSEADEAIFELLCAWRSEIATERSLPPYGVFHDATLRSIARTKPETEQELIAISGIGPAKTRELRRRRARPGRVGPVAAHVSKPAPGCPCSDGQTQDRPGVDARIVEAVHTGWMTVSLRRLLLLAAGCLLSLLVGCSGSSVESTIAATPATNDPVPTAQPTPVATQAATPVPASTPTPVVIGPTTVQLWYAMRGTGGEGPTAPQPVERQVVFDQGSTVAQRLTAIVDLWVKGPTEAEGETGSLNFDYRFNHCEQPFAVEATETSAVVTLCLRDQPATSPRLVESLEQTLAASGLVQEAALLNAEGRCLGLGDDSGQSGDSDPQSCLPAEYRLTDAYRCPFGRATTTALVTEVDEWANTRLAPSLEAAEAERFQARSLVTVYPSTLSYDGSNHWWITVQLRGKGRCASIAAHLLTGTFGNLADVMPGVSYELPTTGSWKFAERESVFDPTEWYLEGSVSTTVSLRVYDGKRIEQHLNRWLETFERLDYDYPENWYEEVVVDGANRAVRPVAIISESGDVGSNLLLIEVGDFTIEAEMAVYIEDVAPLDEMRSFLQSIEHRPQYIS